MSMNKQELDILAENITNLAELNVFKNIQIFVNEVMIYGETSEERILLLKKWLDLTISDLEKRLEEN